MKNSLLSILFVFCLASCDKIKDPIVKKQSVVGSKFITKNNATVSNYKKTLLEDYTGMKCPNCPDAAVTAANLLARYGDSLVVISVHAGSFAKPFGNFKEDYRTDVGDIWNGTAGFNIPSNPNGIVNRTNYASNGLIILQTKWTSAVAMANKDAMVVKLDVTTNYDTTAGALNTEVKAVFKAASSARLSISIVLIEDEVFGLQDIRGVETENYEFKEMLRGAVNGDWGAPLVTSTKKINDTVTYSFNDFNVKGLKYTVLKTPPFTTKGILVDDKHVSAVVFVFNTDTREVMQVEKVKIR